MALTFPSAEWVEEYKKQINLSEGYKKAGATWTAGPVALVTLAKPEIGINEDVGIWLDLHQGVCREAKIVTSEEAQKSLGRRLTHSRCRPSRSFSPYYFLQK